MERDFTGKMTQFGSKRVAQLRKRMSERIPLGPMRAYLTKPEQRKKLQNMDPQAKTQLMQQVGEQEWMRMMSELYGHNTDRN